MSKQSLRIIISGVRNILLASTRFCSPQARILLSVHAPDGPEDLSGIRTGCSAHSLYGPNFNIIVFFLTIITELYTFISAGRTVYVVAIDGVVLNFCNTQQVEPHIYLMIMFRWRRRRLKESVSTWINETSSTVSGSNREFLLHLHPAKKWSLFVPRTNYQLLVPKRWTHCNPYSISSFAPSKLRTHYLLCWKLSALLPIILCLEIGGTECGNELRHASFCLSVQFFKPCLLSLVASCHSATLLSHWNKGNMEERWDSSYGNKIKLSNRIEQLSGQDVPGLNQREGTNYAYCKYQCTVKG